MTKSKFAHLEIGQALKLKLGTGPVARDGKTPYVGPSAWLTNTFGMKSVIANDTASILTYLAMPDTAEIEVIDAHNQSFHLTVRPIDTEAVAARVAAALRRR